MFKSMLLVAAGVSLAIVATPASSAQAQGLHFQAGGLHFDIGSPHGYYGNRYYSNHGANYGYRYHAQRSYHPRRTHLDWHDTSHWDYHPTEVYRHGNHYHVQPGHYDWHSEGHYDVHRGRRGHRH